MVLFHTLIFLDKVEEFMVKIEVKTVGEEVII